MNEYLKITNECNLDLMARYEDNYFDLAIVDPPYGIDWMNQVKNPNKGKNWKQYDNKEWDKNIPTQKYFDELFRVSKNQIIWGGNYMIEYLYSTPCIVIWDKMQEFSGATFEVAWTSFKSPSKAFRMSRVQAYTHRNKIHPTQKPFELYQYLFSNYAEKGNKILDTHLGSGSIAVALDNVNKIEKMELELTACELDKEYYKNAIKFIESETNWQSLF